MTCSACSAHVEKAVRKLEGITVADAMLVWLKVYPFESLRTMSSAELGKSLGAVWTDVKGLSQSDPISVSTEGTEEEKAAPPDQGQGLWVPVISGQWELPQSYRVPMMTSLLPILTILTLSSDYDFPGVHAV